MYLMDEVEMVSPPILSHKPECLRDYLPFKSLYANLVNSGELTCGCACSGANARKKQIGEM